MRTSNVTRVFFCFRVIVFLIVVLFSGIDMAFATSSSETTLVSMAYDAPYYSPAQAVVPGGNMIQVFNATSSPHTLTHDGCRHSGPCRFDTGVLRPGEVYRLSGLPPGRYSYYCVLHPIMQGEIIIIPSSSPSSSAARPLN